MSNDMYRFEEPLIEGLVVKRPNRFIMDVMIDGAQQRCHCPTTGRIGDIRFKGIPCLVERSRDASRSTWGTVEAISLDPPEKEDKSWIGIDQGRANDIVAFFLRSGQLELMVGEVRSLRREVKMGDSRLDFMINDDLLLEVKTPLHMLIVKGYPEHASTEGFTSFERTMRHFMKISEHVPDGNRGIVLLCHFYDAPRFKVPPNHGGPSEMMKNAVRRATERGVENWQANFRLDRTGVELLDCFELGLFDTTRSGPQ